MFKQSRSTFEINVLVSENVLCPDTGRLLLMGIAFAIQARFILTVHSFRLIFCFQKISKNVHAKKESEGL